jgi:hypothetical protein
MSRLWVLVVLVGCQEQGVTKVNNAPEAVITSHDDGDVVDPLSTVAVRGAVSDADNGPDELVATWFVDGAAVCADLVPAGDGAVSCELAVELDDVEVSLEVRDPSNATGSARVTLVAGDAGDQSPVVIVVDPSSGESFYEGDPIVFQATVSDNADAPEALALEWSSDLDGVFSTDPAAATGIALATASGLSVGQHVVALGATDSDGFYGAGFVTLEIVDCARPWYADVDDDGYGDPGAVVEDCTEPLGYVDNDADCDDGNPFVNPAASEACDDGLDNDCDGRVDEGCLGTNCFEDDAIVTDDRYWRLDGALAVDDASSKLGFYRDDFELAGVAGQDIAVHLWSEEFDTHLELYDPDCALYAQVGDGARSTNAFLQVRLPTDGIWTVVATSGAPGAVGDFVFEVIDDAYDVGLNCSLDTDTFDVVSAPYSDSFSGFLDNGDADFGGGFYFDDIEFYAFYGDQLELNETSAAFDPILSLFDPDCALETYDEDGGDGNAARVITTIERTGIYTAAPWAEYSGSTGAYSVTIDATF